METSTLASIFNQFGAYGAVAILAGWCTWFLFRKHTSTQENHIAQQDKRIAALEAKVEEQYKFILETLTGLTQSANDREHQLARIIKSVRAGTPANGTTRHTASVVTVQTMPVPVETPVSADADTEVIHQPQQWYTKMGEGKK